MLKGHRVREGWIGRHGAVAICIAVFLTGCESLSEQQSLSIDEAKNIAIEFESTGLAAPPRSLVGLEPLPFSLESVIDAKACVKPAERMSEEKLDELQTSVPAKQLGVYGKGHISWRFRGWAQREHRLGQLSNAIALQKRAIETGYLPAEIAGNEMLLATYYANAGNFKIGAQYYDRSEPRVATAAASSSDRSCRIKFKFWQHRARGMIRLAKGELAAAHTSLLAAERLLTEWKDAPGNCDPHGRSLQAEILLSRARSLLWQGRTIEAETLSRQAYKVSRKTRPLTLNALSDSFFEQGRFEDSLRVALGAIDGLNRLCAPSDALERAKAHEAVARAHLGLGRWDEAAEAFEKLRDLLKTDPETWERRFKFSPGRGLALLRSGKVEQARDVLTAVAAEQESRLGADNYLTIETRAFLAMTLAGAGDHAGALSQLREAVPAMLTAWREAAGDSANQVGRSFRLRLVAETYLALLLDPEMGGNASDASLVAEAFQIADGVTTRGVQRALAEGTARSLAKDPATEKLIRQRQDLEKQVQALRYRLNEAHGSKEADTPDVIAALQDQIRTTESALRRLEREVAALVPEYAALTNPKPVALSEARAVLEAGEALILTFAGADRLFVWAVPREGPALAAVAPLGRDALRERADGLRAALAPDAQTLGDVPAYDVAAGYRLYRQLLEPVASAWKDARRLLVVADGPLGTLPFAVLPTADLPLAADDAVLFDGYRQVPWLARSHATARLPSVAALIALRRTAVNPEGRHAFIGFGDPWFDPAGDDVAAADTRGVMRGVAAAQQPITLRNLPQTRAADSASLASLPRLPDTAEEILAVAETLGARLDRDVYLGLAASERRVKVLNETGELKKYRTLSFATHGLVPGDLDGLVKPALAMAAPGPEDIALGDDGLLTSDEILGLRLDADWAVLSACNTAAADGAGAEAVSGLGRAFFYAGAKAILVSNWPVHSDATRALMTALFARYAAAGNRGRAEALRAAMLHLIDEGGYQADGRRLFSYAHPIFWAPFMIVGDGG